MGHCLGANEVSKCMALDLSCTDGQGDISEGMQESRKLFQKKLSSGLEILVWRGSLSCLLGLCYSIKILHVCNSSVFLITAKIFVFVFTSYQFVTNAKYLSLVLQYFFV